MNHNHKRTTHTKTSGFRSPKGDVKCTVPRSTKPVSYLSASGNCGSGYRGYLLHDASDGPTKVDIFIAISIGDYLKDTMWLNTLEHGVYFLLIMAYWMNDGPLPDDDDALAATTKLALDQWLQVRRRIAGFFDVRDAHWHHKRIEADLLKAKANRDAAHKRGVAGANGRWKGKMKKAARNNAQASSSQCPSPSPSASSSPVNNNAKASNILPASAQDRPVVENLMTRCRMTLGMPEMETNGGLWRVRAREDWCKLARVLDTIESELKEGKVFGNMGAYASDLWKRYA